MAKSVTLNGTEYASSVKAAQDLFADGKTVSEITKILNEAGSSITYQSVYAYTAGAEKTAARRAKYRILSLGKSGRKTAGDIAKRTGVSTSKVVATLKKAGIAIVSKEAIARAEKEAKAKKDAEKEAKKAEQKAKKDAKKAKKNQEQIEEVSVDQVAMESAMADMEADGELE